MKDAQHMVHMLTIYTLCAYVYTEANTENLTESKYLLSSNSSKLSSS